MYAIVGINENFKCVSVMGKIKLGHISYANSLPVYDSLFEGDVEWDGELISSYPARLNELMANGELDISPVSSIEYAKHQDQYYLVDDLSINSHGSVFSVLLASMYSLENLDGKTVGFTEASATSRTLLRILLEKEFQLNCKYKDVPIEDCGEMKGLDAELIIGDAAFKFKDSYPYCYDLASEWLRVTGQSIVFAVWVIQKKSLEKNRDAIIQTIEVLKKSYAMIDKDRVLLKAKKELKIDDSELSDYFEALGYGLDKNLQKSLLYFYEKSFELEICPNCDNLQFWNSEL
ncbi:MAG: hypothetical protein COA79_16910 [Planctomycetota bacterium]|nr:MAG: hypothetical protein COA79_16910 [Planctomycetota bacterium]